jgi:hypothetical protein
MQKAVNCDRLFQACEYLLEDPDTIGIEMRACGKGFIGILPPPRQLFTHTAYAINFRFRIGTVDFEIDQFPV